MNDLIDAIRCTHESISQRITTIYNVSACIRRLTEQVPTDDGTTRFAFRPNSSPEWYNVVGESAWMFLQFLIAQSESKFLDCRAVFTRANRLLAERNKVDPIARMGQRIESSWHAVGVKTQNWFEYYLDIGFDENCMATWRDLLHQESCPLEFKTCNALWAIQYAVEKSGLSDPDHEQLRARLDLEFDAAVEIASDSTFWDQSFASDEDGSVVAKRSKPDDYLWLTGAELECLTDVDRGTIKRAGDRGDIQTNGETGAAKRFSWPSFYEWYLRRSNRQT